MKKNKRLAALILFLFIFAQAHSAHAFLGPVDGVKWVCKQTVMRIPPVKKAVDWTSEKLRITAAKKAINRKFKIDQKKEKIMTTLRVEERKAQVKHAVKFEQRKTAVVNAINYEDRKDKFIEVVTFGKIEKVIVGTTPMIDFNDWTLAELIEISNVETRTFPELEWEFETGEPKYSSDAKTVLVNDASQDAQAAVQKRKWYQRKKKEEPVPPSQQMVHTVDEWKEKASSVPLSERKVPEYKHPVDEKMKPIEPPKKYLALYNKPPGTQDINISKITKDLSARSQGVVSPDFKKMAVTQYYYAPSENQVSSEALIMPLEKRGSRINRMLNAHIMKADKKDNPQGGTYEFVRDLYNAFVIVDWSADSKAILLKEKVGSLRSGNYMTYLWMMVYDDEGNMRYRKCPELNDAIKGFWKNRTDINLDTVRWDILPLGWSSVDYNEAIVLAYAWQKNGTRVYLGGWSLNRVNGEIGLLSLEEKTFDIRANGLRVKLEDY